MHMQAKHAVQGPILLMNVFRSFSSHIVSIVTQKGCCMQNPPLALSWIPRLSCLA